MDEENKNIPDDVRDNSVGRTSGILRSNNGSRSRIKITSPLLPIQQVEPSSPQPSVDRVSVTFAVVEDNVDWPREASSRRVQQTVNGNDISKNISEMQGISIADDEEGDEDDYSASACAIMQRRNSTKRQSRRKRRSSSPFSVEAEATLRRRSSAYTISSGETAISIEESGSQEQIFEKLKLHKEVLSGVKQQPWSLRRKIRLVRQAKAYVRRHEGVLQERLAQTKSTKDAIARISLFITKKWQYFRRELVNLQTWLIPWELRIKEIESHFGSAVASYFTFLRWMFWINLVTAVILTAFVAIPEMLTADPAAAGERKIMLREERIKSKHLLTLWEFEGILKYSPFFYGWYTNQDSESGYRLPLAYFAANLIVYIYSFVAILRKMAENSRLSKLTEKEDECAFSWKLFTGWDFMIGNPETAHNRMASIVLGFKEALLEEAEKQKDERNWKIILMRIFVNASILFLLGLSAYAVVNVVARSAEKFEQRDWWRQNEITIVMSLISYLFPMIFEILGLLESFHPRTQLCLQLARILFLNLLNLITLIFAQFNQIISMKQDLKNLQPTVKNCTYKLIKCDSSKTKLNKLSSLASLSLVLMSNVTVFQNQTEAPKTTLPSLLMIPENFYLNPILDNKTLQEIYNVGDYSFLDYTYEDYDGGTSEIHKLNETITLATENTTEENNTTAETLEGSDTFETTTNFLSDENVTSSTSSIYNFSEENNDTSWSNLDYEETTVYNENNETSISNTSDTLSEDFSTTSSTVDTTTTEEIATDEYSNKSSIITTLYTNTESSVITTKNIEETSETITEETNETITEETSETITEEISEISTEETTTVDTSSMFNERVIPLPKKDYVVKCFEQVCTTTTPDTIASSKLLDLKTRKKLRRLCWETMFGQELAKLTVMDVVLTVVSTLSIDFFRAVFVRFMNRCWCWDLEKQFPQYGDFKIAENILHLVNNQGIVWMGMFFSPGLPALNILKLGILMYLRSWAVLTCNVPHEVIFRASRSNNFYFAILLTMLFLCVLPVAYAIVWVEPSWHCGPFSGYKKIYHLATKQLTDSLPETIQRILDYIASPAFVIPWIVLMTLIIYYMVSLTSSLRESNNDLKIQLRHERTEERRKLFKIVRRREELNDATLLKWKKSLPVLFSKSSKAAKTRVSKGDSEGMAAQEISGEMQIYERKRLSLDVVELTDMEQDSLPHDQTQYVAESSYKERGPIREISGGRMSRILRDSWESQSSDCAVIPEIRINEAEGKLENHHSVAVEYQAK